MHDIERRGSPLTGHVRFYSFRRLLRMLRDTELCRFFRGRRNLENFRSFSEKLKNRYFSQFIDFL